MKTKILLIITTLLFAGCVSAPTVTPEQIAAAVTTPEPGEAGHATITAAMELLLKDAGSAQYKWLAPHKDALRTGGVVTYGWEVPVLVNAKNSYGGFTGFERWSFFLVDGKVASYQDPSMAKMDFWTPVK